MTYLIISARHRHDIDKDFINLRPMIHNRATHFSSIVCDKDLLPGPEFETAHIPESGSHQLIFLEFTGLTRFKPDYIPGIGCHTGMAIAETQFIHILATDDDPRIVMTRFLTRSSHSCPHNGPLS